MTASTVPVAITVLDTETTVRSMRRAAIGEALLSCLFGAIMIAIGINLVASLLGRYDPAVIGAGPAGKVAATRVNTHGFRTALIEHGLVGGECGYWACHPVQDPPASGGRSL